MPEEKSSFENQRAAIEYGLAEIAGDPEAEITICVRPGMCGDECCDACVLINGTDDYTLDEVMEKVRVQGNH